jgi:hypothetical protein
MGRSKASSGQLKLGSVVQINGYDQQFSSNSVLLPLCFANAKPKIV